MTAHQFIKTYYMPALLKTVNFAAGLQLLFGDQASAYCGLFRP